MIDVDSLMTTLAKKRPAFHSEADFQHALAWEIHEAYPDAAIRLEYPVTIEGKRIHLDMWLTHGDQHYAVELKYGTSRSLTQIDGEQYDLRDQSANDLIRHAFCKDIRRLEQVNELLPGTRGVAIFLSNYPPFWNPDVSDRITNDAQFRVHDGRKLSGTLVWGESSKSPEKPVSLTGMYTMRWKPYSEIPFVKNAQFRYLAVRV